MQEKMDTLIHNAYCIIDKEEQVDLCKYDKEATEKIPNRTAYKYMRKRVIGAWKRKNAKNVLRRNIFLHFL